MTSTRTALTLLRVGTALILIIHGVARIRLGIVDDFGVVLGRWGFPAGFALAWTITILEIVGGSAMAAVFFVRSLAGRFAFQLAMGVYLIQGRVGWFVVGAGRNGMEFSALLILCLGVIALTAGDAHVLGAAAPGEPALHARHRRCIRMAENEREENFPPDTESGTTSEKDFGRTDRYANKDDEETFNFTTTGDGTSWDSGRTSSIAEGTRVENDLREADAESPGVSGPKPNRDDAA